MKFVKQKKQQIILLLIIALGAFLRLYGINWDQGFHLHPDERFLTMVGNAMKIPNTVVDYFNPQISSFNPSNIGFGFFVYGIFPLTLNKILAVLLGNDNYNSFTLQGRFLSALFDVLTLFLVYKTTELFERKYNLNSSVKYWASFFYAIAVLPIKLSHFFAVDTFLNFFMFASFYFILRFSFRKHFGSFVLSAIFLGVAVGSKISGVSIFPLNLFFLLKTDLDRTHNTLIRKMFFGALLMVLYILIVYFSLRLADPYYFKSSNFFNSMLNQVFIGNIKTLGYLSTKDVWYPPAVQWIHKPPIIFSLANLIVFGVGVPYFLAVILGLPFTLGKFRKREIFIIPLWVFVLFVYQSTQFGQPMRYFISIYPFLAVFAGISLGYFADRLNKVLLIGVLLLFLLWPAMFISIYTQKHSRVEASEWIYQYLDDKSVILGEHWNDLLPLPVQNNYGKNFLVEELPVFAPDSPEKWQQMNNLLANADYLVLSSNIGWGSIPAVPDKYPLMSKFYQDLFDGRLRFKRIKEFASYPSLRYLGIPIEFVDDWADESFTLYDHPKVIIFEKSQ